MPVITYKRLEKDVPDMRYTWRILKKNLKIYIALRRTECFISQDTRHFSTLKKVTVCSSETSVNFYSTTGTHIAEDNTPMEVIAVNSPGMSRQIVVRPATRSRVSQLRSRSSNSGRGDRFPALI
jgi:hypothetical protein